MFKKAFTSTIPVLSGYVVLGMGFGIIMSSNGFNPIYSLLMSVFIYAGSMQYVTINLLTENAALLTVALTTFMVNARHLFYGISMIEKYRDVGKIKPYLIYGLTDETYSLVCNDFKEFSQKEKNKYYFFVTILDHIYWVSGSIIGALLGAIIPFSMEGIDFALTALFLSVVTEQWLSSKTHFSAITGILSTLICLIIFGTSNFLIPSMIVIAIILVTKIIIDDKKGEKKI